MVDATTSASVGSTPSPRSVRTTRAVLDATAQLLTHGGLTAATIDAIRDRSGVSKTTIYKHWPNRLCVVIDAFVDSLAVQTTLPDTGSAQGDFTEQLRRVTLFYDSSIGRVLAQILASALQDDTASHWLSERLDLSREHGIRQLWDRAVARGEVDPRIDPDIAMDLIFGPVMWRVVAGRRALTEDQLEDLANLALMGLRGQVSITAAAQSGGGSA